jgi:hypothetical protein
MFHLAHRFLVLAAYVRPICLYFFSPRVLLSVVTGIEAAQSLLV